MMSDLPLASLDARDIVEVVVRAMVDLEDEVFVTEVIGARAHVIEMSVAKSDLGKVIGKHGVHADALRTLLAAIGGKDKRRYLLEIVEPEDSGME
jgi:predicted RNA-binding protein YlqC (UPF0109 family)